jgi:hypothetical protein
MSGCHNLSVNCKCPECLNKKIETLSAQDTQGYYFLKGALDGLEDKCKQMEDKLSSQLYSLTEIYKHISVQCASNQDHWMKVHDRIEHQAQRITTQTLRIDYLEKLSVVPSRRPFKCPVCEGASKIYEDNLDPSKYCYCKNDLTIGEICRDCGKPVINIFKTCNSCNGKGIVWG